MRYLRLIRPAWWHTSKKRFVRLAFRNSSPERGGGISIMDRNCAEERSNTACEHVGKYHLKYRSPVLLWQLNSESLPTHEIPNVEITEDSDPCHRNLMGIADERAERIFKEDYENNQFGNFLICYGNGQPQPVTQATI